MTSPSKASGAGAGVSVGVSVEDEASGCGGVDSTGACSVGFLVDFGAVWGAAVRDYELGVAFESNIWLTRWLRRTVQMHPVLLRHKIPCEQRSRR